MSKGGQRIFTVGGGGVAAPPSTAPVTAAHMEWGPDFGERSGSDGVSAEAQVALALAPYGLIYGLTPAAKIALVRLSMTNQQLTVGVVAALDSLGLVNRQLRAGSTVDLDSLRLNGNFQPNVAVSGSLATSRALSAASIIRLASLALHGNLQAGVRILTAFNVTGLTLVPAAALRLSSLVLSTAVLVVGSKVKLSRIALVDDLHWVDVIVSNTGFTSPANFSDTNEGTGALLSAAASGIGGLTENTTNGDLIASHSDLAAPWTSLTIDDVDWEYRYRTTSTGTQISAGTVDIDINYSIDEGLNWVLQENVTSVNAGAVTRDVDMNAIVTSWTHINQFRIQLVGLVRSGTGLSKVQNFFADYSRLRIQAHQDF